MHLWHVSSINGTGTKLAQFILGATITVRGTIHLCPGPCRFELSLELRVGQQDLRRDA